MQLKGREVVKKSADRNEYERTDVMKIGNRRMYAKLILFSNWRQKELNNTIFRHFMCIEKNIF